MTEEKEIQPRFKPKEPIPEFKSREEEAEFWDTHDLADYWDEFKNVKVRFAKNLSEGINIRLDHETIEKLKRIAKERGIPVSSLAHIWILERLQKAEGSTTPNS